MKTLEPSDDSATSRTLVGPVACLFNPDTILSPPGRQVGRVGKSDLGKGKDGEGPDVCDHELFPASCAWIAV